MFKLMRSGCCFVFLFISSPLSHWHILLLSILPQTHARSGNVYAKQLWNTIWSAARSLGGRLKAELTVEFPADTDVQQPRPEGRDETGSVRRDAKA